jgi:hypothetical protein
MISSTYLKYEGGVKDNELVALVSRSCRVISAMIGEREEPNVCLCMEPLGCRMFACIWNH